MGQFCVVAGYDESEWAGDIFSFLLRPTPRQLLISLGVMFPLRDNTRPSIQKIRILIKLKQSNTSRIPTRHLSTNSLRILEGTFHIIATRKPDVVSIHSLTSMNKIT